MGGPDQTETNSNPVPIADDFPLPFRIAFPAIKSLQLARHGHAAHGFAIARRFRVATTIRVGYAGHWWMIRARA